MFEIIATDQHSRARYGKITTAHSVIETPAFVVVGTHGAVRCLSNCLKSFCYTEGNEIPKRYYSSPVSCHGTACIYQDFSEETLDSY